jgi:hypothetical protein
LHLAEGSNSRANSLMLRPAHANSMIRGDIPARMVDGFAAFGNLLFLIPQTPSTKLGQLQVEVHPASVITSFCSIWARLQMSPAFWLKG